MAITENPQFGSDIGLKEKETVGPRFTLFLEDQRARDVRLVGREAARLAELRSIGIKVPEAFMVTAGGEIFQQDTKIQKRISVLDELSSEWLEAKLRGNGLASSFGSQITEEGRTIEKMMEDLRFPDSVEKEIGEAYDELCKRVSEPNMPVAVRNSQVDENDLVMSFSGQYGKEGVLTAIRKCFTSRFGESVGHRNAARLEISREELFKRGDIDKAIKAGSNFSHYRTNLAVMVSGMIYGPSGFALSIANNGHSVVRINAGSDSWDVNAKNGSIVSKVTEGKKERSLFSRDGIGNEASEIERRRPPLSDEQVGKITQDVIAIRGKFGEVHAEFVLHGGEPLFVLAKPV